MISKAMLDIQKLTSTFSTFSQQQSLNILSTTLKTLKHPSNIPQTSLKQHPSNILQQHPSSILLLCIKMIIKLKTSCVFWIGCLLQLLLLFLLLLVVVVVKA